MTKLNRKGPFTNFCEKPCFGGVLSRLSHQNTKEDNCNVINYDVINIYVNVNADFTNYLYYDDNNNHATPLVAFDLRESDETVRVAVGLRTTGSGIM